MQRKIFIGVALPRAVKKRLIQKVEKWENLPVRWSQEKNLHLGILNLGYVDDEKVFDICSKINKAVENEEIFDINFDKIELGPNAENAKMVWFSGQESQELKNLHRNIEQELGLFRNDKKEFRPHIILGRVKQYGWQKLKEHPQVLDSFKISIPTESVQVLESTIIDGKRAFVVVESCSLKC